MNAWWANSKRWIMIVLALAAVGLVGLAPNQTAAQQTAASLPEGAQWVMASPVDPNLLFSAVDAVVYRSEDGGQTWAAGAVLPSRVTALVTGNHSRDLLYVGTESGGALRSFDLGQSWQPVNEGLGRLPGTVLGVSAMAVDPEQDSIVYAATGYWLGTSQVRFSPAAVVFSTDGGAHWLPLAQWPLTRPAVTALAAQPDTLAVMATLADGSQSTYSADVAALVSLLGSEETPATRRAAAAHALGLLGDKAAAPALTAALQSGDAAIASRAAEALGALRAAEAVPMLAALLMDPQAVAPSAAADALATIGTPEAMQALLAALDNDELSPARYGAMAALERLGSAAVPGLLEVLAGGAPTVRGTAAELLGWIGDPAAVDDLVAALQNGSADVRSQAAWALGEIADPAAWHALASAAQNDASAAVRLYAAQALSRLPQPAAGAVAQPKAAEEPASAASSPAPAVSENGETATVRATGLSRWLPILRYAVLILVLALAAFLPWYQSMRENHRHRPN